MRVACLFSGGTDSALAALLLDRFCAVHLVTGTFGFDDRPPDAAARAARRLELDHSTVDLDPAVGRAAVETMAADGFPRNGLQDVHEHALETVASRADVEAVADGTRRDDRVPRLTDAAARSLEDRHDVAYCRPLAGLGRSAIDALVETALEVERGRSSSLATGDYEAELRTRMAAEYGTDRVAAVFPEHTQSVVQGRR